MIIWMTDATLQFLQKSDKLDAKAYAEIEASQVAWLISSTM